MHARRLALEILTQVEEQQAYASLLLDAKLKQARLSQQERALTTELTKQGWQVRKAKVDGGCYEVYGTTPEGDRVEAYFDPVSFVKLYVERRGEVLYKKP